MWEDEATYRTPAVSSDRPKVYVLDFFPYPSGDGLSVGHAKNYVPTDVLARYYRMRGFAVLHPMGWDAFGLPAENDALLRGRHPRDTTREYSANYKRQLTLIGCSYDWTRELSTSDPAFYAWTQWTFLLLLRRGLAYRAIGWQWWCPRCRTILANEQVEDGRCWRHGDTPVERRALEQWYVRTTAYADRLVADLDSLDWPESIKAMQRNWIGRTEGAEVVFPIADGPHSGGRIDVFTTRPEIVPAAAFLALVPEHPHAADLATPDRRSDVEAFIASAVRRSEIDRIASGRPPGGVFIGAHATNPLTGNRIPIYVVDYAVAQHDSTAGMGVPALDARDFAFAQRIGLPEVPGTTLQENSYQVPGDIARELSERGAGGPVVRYRMRDWLISRQRFWGAPIPVVYCDHDGIVPVPEDQLPVLLPEVERYETSGTGRSPLDAIAPFVDTRCPHCRRPARRETDTLDGFADSNWYFLRFASPRDAAGPWDPEAVGYWLPVDWYVGGPEHAVMHLLYARFFTKVLQDAGLVAFGEPFVRLRNQGSMLSSQDGMRMSKSRGNVITPDEVVDRYGADALRAAVMFIGPFDQDATWDPSVMTGASRFMRRLFGLFVRAAAAHEPASTPGADPAPIRARLHQLVAAAGESIPRFRFNTLFAELMTFTADAIRWEKTWAGTPLWRDVIDVLVRLVAPLVPFVAEEAWHRMGRTGSVHHAAWPVYDPAMTGAAATRTIVVTVDGRVRDRFVVETGTDRAALIRLARSRPRIIAALEGQPVTHIVVVPDRLVNFVTVTSQ